jgi:predicted nucleic acid binding AN1-type Zn finger protein
MSNMIFLAALLLNWSEIVRLLSLRERKKGVGDGTVEGHKYTVVQRGDQIYIVLPDHPRDRCESIVKKLLQKLKPEAEIKVSSVGYASTHCNYCLTSSLTYRCHRCGRWYCGEHRLPERHNCPGDGEGEVGAKRAQQKEVARKEKEKEKKEKIIAIRLPCA